jgi:hypothetical protein
MSSRETASGAPPLSFNSINPKTTGINVHTYPESHDNEQPPHDPNHPEVIKRRRFFYRLMALITTFFTFVMIWVALGVYQKYSSKVGDRKDITSYGFIVDNLTIPTNELKPANQRDYQPVLGELRIVDLDQVDNVATPGPVAVTPAVVNELKNSPFQRVVITNDPVIGVVSDDGHARCYPIRYVRWHELINDTVGDTPVLITYSLLTDSSVAFDRRANGQTHTFGYSGYLYNSNLIFYNVTDDLRQPEDPEGKMSSASLFCQLTLGPIAGPAAGTETEAGWKLKPMDTFYGTFEEWLERHPDTTVFTGDKTYKDRYKHKPMGNYFDKNEVHFPLNPAPPADDSRRLMDRVIAYQKADGSWDFTDYPLAEGVTLPAEGMKIHMTYFAWYGMRAQLEKWRP